MSADRRLVAGCLLGSFVGTEAPAWLLDCVRDGLGGVLLFAQNVVDDEQVARMCARLRSARADVIIAIDEEGGDVTRLDARLASDTPCPAAFGYVDDVRLTEAAYAELGHRVHSLGIDLTLAPCADINSNPQNPIIGVRSFGETADVVARHVTAAVNGFRRGGVAVCVKHFPGHGDTSDDTHLGTARIAASMTTLTDRELVPFRAAIAAGAEGVLTAHLVAEALDAEPVSLSAPWTELLRETMSYEGVVVSDALDMDGVAGGRGIAGVADAAVRALVAGADFLCLGSNFDESMTSAVIDAVLPAIENGTIARAQLELSHKRIETLRADGRAPDVTATDAAQRVAAGAIVVDGQLPPGPYAVLECRPRLSMASFNVSWGIAADLAQRGWTAMSVSATDDLDAVCAQLVAAAGDQPIVVVVRDSAVHPWQRAVIERCVIAGRATVVVEMGWPGAWRPSSATYVVTHGAARVSALALINTLEES